MARQSSAALKLDPVPRVYQHASVVSRAQPPGYPKTLPLRCRRELWHVWRWVSTSEDRAEKPPRGLRCACQKRIAE